VAPGGELRRLHGAGKRAVVRGCVMLCKFCRATLQDGSVGLEDCARLGDWPALARGRGAPGSGRSRDRRGKGKSHQINQELESV